MKNSNKEQVIFDSRDEYYKDIPGAIQAGKTTSMKLLVDETFKIKVLKLSVTFDKDGSKRVFIMKRTRVKSHPGYVMYSVSADFPEAGLFWYRFIMDFEDGNSVSIGRDERTNKPVLGSRVEWQQTVYSQQYQAPEWIYGGVFYHIFVDRFKKGVGSRRKNRADIVYHDNWEDIPEYRPNEEGEILNNDFFGGSLSGIIEELPRLKDLGVTCLYLSPIFEAYSNHKYDTSDYMKIDPGFGDEREFSMLCDVAEAYGMRVILDGVFSHTGSDSVYFNKKKTYGEGGAYNDPQSPYRDWYTFKEDGTYESWWGFDTLPCLDKSNPKVREFINGEDGVVRTWLRRGAAGWRLDVVDELTADFVAELVAAAKAEKSDALIIGEVWEDASCKTAYDERKNYFDGSRLDSTMNYPFRTAIIDFVRHGKVDEFREAVESIVEHYPQYVLDSLMNNLGTHDTERILTMLGGDESVMAAERELQAHTSMSAWDKVKAIEMLKMAVFLQMTLPGVPCIYYGDEVGVEGYRDPFNRSTYPWGRENKELYEWYKNLIQIRRNNPAFVSGRYKTFIAEDGVFGFFRIKGNTSVLAVANVSKENKTCKLLGSWKNILTGKSSHDKIEIPACGFGLYKRR